MLTHMRKKLNEARLVDQKFGFLTIQKAWRNSKKALIVRCLCDCGRSWQGSFACIRSSHTKSCGCLSYKRRNNQEWQKFKINPERK